MRPPVDRGRIERFLEALGREARAPARVYLVGGATLVWLGLRPETLDIDLTYEVAPSDQTALVEAIRSLKERLNVNVEEVSPGDFLPLPSGHRERAIPVGRYGPVDLFHFDLVSAALSKIERGWEKDFEDVRLLLDSGRPAWSDLEAAYAQILPRMGRESLKQDPERLRRNFELLRAMRAGPAPS